MKTYSFHYFFLRHLYDSDDNAEMKSRDIKAGSLSEAIDKWDRSGKHGDLTRDLYQIDENGVTVWTQQ